MRPQNALRVMAVLLIAAFNAGSQNNLPAPATVFGVVTDPTGATLPRTRVMLVDLKTFKAQTASVGVDGKFTFPGLIPGDFALIVAGPGDPRAACWKPAIRQVDARKTPIQDLRIALSLDFERCGEGIVNWRACDSESRPRRGQHIQAQRFNAGKSPSKRRSPSRDEICRAYGTRLIYSRLPSPEALG